ncbi:hypothetical protein [Marihabitans asiaticum]|uniref:hypothetical protein n=1 Tax=Marihabitans asiaticum TaxID=415218 RepID=UPI001478AAC9|nr:hypothetical protein [Marihabitans asiaticum]
MRDARGEQAIDHRLRVDVGETFLGDVAEELLADVAVQATDRPGLGLDGKQVGDLVADVLGHLRHSARELLRGSEAFSVAGERTPAYRVDDKSWRIVSGPRQLRDGLADQQVEAGLGGLVRPRQDPQDTLAVLLAEVHDMDDLLVAVGEAEEQQVVEFPRGMRACAAPTLVAHEPVDQTPNGSDREIAAVEVEEEDSEVLFGGERRELGDIDELGDLGGVEV